MKVSFEGIGQWCATFLGGAEEGSVVKVDGAGQIAPCAAGDAFCGAVVCAKEDACTVQMGGFVTLSYSGEAPALGYTALCADGEGGVQSGTVGGSQNGAQENNGGEGGGSQNGVQENNGGEGGGQAKVQSAAENTAPGGRSYWVVDRDETGKTVTILL